MCRFVDDDYYYTGKGNNYGHDNNHYFPESTTDARIGVWRLLWIMQTIVERYILWIHEKSTLANLINICQNIISSMNYSTDISLIEWPSNSLINGQSSVEC